MIEVGKIFLVQIIGMAVRKKREASVMLLGIVKMILETSEGGIGRWKLTEVEEHFFGEDCNVACMNK